MNSTARARIIPIVVACPLFLQNLDTSVMATALPSIAHSLGVLPLQLNLAITSYLLSLAVFLPVSGWCAERFGARRVFCFAIVFFSAGSALCGLAQSLPQLVLFRLLQGMGGAMMVPVGRLILLRSVPASQMVSAMVWFTVPPAIGRIAGPLFGGAIVTWTSWRWIFLINVPFGLLGIALAMWFIGEQPAEEAPAPLDMGGFVLLSLGLAGLLGALETAGHGLVDAWVSWAAGAAGALAMALYWLRSRGRDSALIDLGVLRYPSYRATVIGALPLRIAIGASPFLLPLMMQLGFGLSPLQSGTLTVATAAGALATRGIMARAIRRIGFRRLLMATTALTAVSYVSYGLFRAETPHLQMFCVLVLGGLINSLGLVSVATLGFSQIPKPRMSHATALSSMAQQLSISFGVVLATTLVSLAAWVHGGSAAHLTAADFPPAFYLIGAMTLLSLFAFARLDDAEGDHLRQP